jgi:hypothetical protein
MTAILGKGWGWIDSKPAMAKHDDDRNDCPDEDTSAEVTEETEESNSKGTINEDIDAWTASRPTKPNLTTAARKLKLNSKKASTRPDTRRPTQDLIQDKTSTKSWHKKTNTDLAQEEDQTEIDEPNDDKEANENDTVWKDVISGEPDHASPAADGGAVTTTIGEFDKPLMSHSLSRASSRNHPPGLT